MKIVSKMLKKYIMLKKREKLKFKPWKFHNVFRNSKMGPAAIVFIPLIFTSQLNLAKRSCCSPIWANSRCRTDLHGIRDTIPIKRIVIVLSCKLYRRTWLPDNWCSDVRGLHKENVTQPITDVPMYITTTDEPMYSIKRFLLWKREYCRLTNTVVPTELRIEKKEKSSTANWQLIFEERHR